MAPRSIATGTISFGLVSIPVNLYPATQPSSALSFNLLHAKDGSRLKQQYVCAKDGEKVERDEMVKGYEFAKDRYVRFTAEELKALDEIASQTIDIAEFVPAADVDAVYFDRAYYLGPEKGGAKAYRLLATAHCPSAANNNYWPEMYFNMAIIDATRRNPYGDTPSPKRFGTVSPLDPEFFLTVEQFADELISGERSGKYSPVWVAQRLDEQKNRVKQQRHRHEKDFLFGRKRWAGG